MRVEKLESPQGKKVKKQLILICTIALLTTACASKRDFYAMSGSRADGTVDMAYDIHGPFDKPIINMNQAEEIASRKCSVWGYDTAEPFGGKSERCNQRNGFGDCMNGQVVIQYQCIGALEASRAAPAKVRAPLMAQQESTAPESKWLLQAEKTAQASFCSKPAYVSGGAGIELYSTTCNSAPTTIRCEFGKCVVQ